MSNIITTQKHIPILFSTLMVQALLDGRKTQTRRIVKDLPTKIVSMELDPSSGWWKARHKGKKEIYSTIKCPYGKVGDILWVRETFTNCLLNDNPMWLYKANQDDQEILNMLHDPFWKPAIHMPKTACRIWLEITGIKAERVQDISNTDSIKEGIKVDAISCRFYDYIRECWWMFTTDSEPESHQASGVVPYPFEAKHSYKTLWDSINGSESWEQNPWVWVLEFEQVSMPLNFTGHNQ